MNPEDTQESATPALPSKKRQSWGALLSIIVILLMVLVGAFYAWGRRIAEQKALAPASLQQ